MFIFCTHFLKVGAVETFLKPLKDHFVICVANLLSFSFRNVSVIIVSIIWVYISWASINHPLSSMFILAIKTVHEFCYELMLC